jgi:hypothetical protein
VDNRYCLQRISDGDWSSIVGKEEVK